MKRTFKTIVAVFVAALTLSLTGCQKDPEDLILGTWLENEVTMTYTQGGQSMTLPGLEQGETVEMTFNEDGTYKSVYHSNDGESEDNGTWSIKDNKLTTVSEGEAITFNIDLLDKKNCNLSYTESDEDEDGPYTISIVIEMTRK